MTRTHLALYVGGVILGLMGLCTLLLGFANAAHASGNDYDLYGCSWGGLPLNELNTSITGHVVAWQGDISIGPVVSITNNGVNQGNITLGTCSYKQIGGPNTADLDTIFSGMGFAPGRYMYAVLSSPPGFPGNDESYRFFDVDTSGGVVIEGQPTGTRISITSPTQGTTTPTTTFDVDLAYTIASDLSTYSLDGSLPDRVGINLSLQNTAYGTTQNLGTDWAISSAVGSYTYSTTTTVEQGDYTLIATLVGDYGFIPPPADCTPFPPFTDCNGSGNVSTIVTALPPPTFSVANGSFPILGFNVGSTSSRNGLATTTCDVLHVGGCFQNALAFLFYPSPDILNQFSFLWSLIKNKPPFGYVSQTILGLRSINASSTPAFSFGDIPLVSTIFTPFRTGLAGILWLGFFIAWYRGRLRHLDI